MNKLTISKIRESVTIGVIIVIAVLSFILNETISIFIDGIIELEMANLLALLALFLSLVNLSINLIPKTFKINIPNKISGVKGNNTLSDLLHVPLTFSNVGRSSGTIVKCELEIEKLNTNSNAKYSWDSFCKTEGGRWYQESTVLPLSVSPKSSITRVITFDNTSTPTFHFTQGNYKLRLLIWVDNHKIPFVDKYFSLDTTVSSNQNRLNASASGNFTIETS